METLYKKDSKGKILQWYAKVMQSETGTHISLESGEFNGKITTTLRTNIKGKNIGKTNETSPFEQAESDLKSIYNKKKREGYKSLSDLKYVNTSVAFGGDTMEQFLLDNLKFDTRDLDGNLKPMKAQQYYRSKKNWKDPEGKVWDDRKYYYLQNPDVPKEKGAIIMTFPCLIQPKLNGVRATISLDKDYNIQILSKEGLRYSLPHITDVFEQYKEVFSATINQDDVIDVIFDGELYIHKEKLQNISSAVKAQNLNTYRISFVCFDLAIPNLQNLARIKIMKSLLHFTTLSLDCPISFITTNIISTDKQVQRYTDRYITEGYEGSIMRKETGVYAFGKRPMDMVKLKRLMDEEFTIIDVVSQDKNPSLGLFVCRTKEGKEFKVTPKGNVDFKELVLFQKHLYVGKPLTCTFYEYTEDGIPFHVIDNIVRDYE